MADTDKPPKQPAKKIKEPVPTPTEPAVADNHATAETDGEEDMDIPKETTKDDGGGNDETPFITVGKGKAKKKLIMTDRGGNANPPRQEVHKEQAQIKGKYIPSSRAGTIATLYSKTEKSA